MIQSLPMNSPPKYVTVVDLHARGWTRTMIEQMLGREDDREPVNHWLNFQGKKVYNRQRVEAHEATEVFRTSFRRSASRRRLSASAVEAVISRSIDLEKRNAHLYLVSMPTERERLLREAANVFTEARRRGYRTPHGC